MNDNNVNKIIFVPGKNPKPPADVHHQQLWRCLLHGVRRVNPEVAESMAASSESFMLTAWNALYYGCEKDIAVDVPWIDRLLSVDSASEQDKKEARSWRKKSAWLLNSIADALPWFIPLIPDPAVKASIRETERYFKNRDDIAQRLRELLKVPLYKLFKTRARIMIIGHSLGSVIAYDTLWELCHEGNNPGQVDHFLTIGSPLGMHFVQARLKGHGAQGRRRYPANVRHWSNVSAQGDLVSLDVTLKDDYHEMLELGLIQSIEDKNSNIYNYFRNEQGLNVHRSYGYLVNPVVGKIVADWWQQGTDSFT